MLPTIDLQFSDIVTFSMDANTPVQLPHAKTTLKAEFAELLQLRFDANTEQGVATGQNLPPGGSQLPPGQGLSIPATSIELETDTDAAVILPQTESDANPVVAPLLSEASSLLRTQTHAAPDQRAVVQTPSLQAPQTQAAVLSNSKNLASAEKPVTVVSGPLILPPKTAPESRNVLPSATQAMPDPGRKPIDPSVTIAPRDNGPQVPAPPATTTIVSNSLPISNRQRITAVERENAKPLVTKVVSGPQDNNAVFEQRYPTRTSLPDATPVSLAPPAVVPRSRIVGIPEQKLPGQMKLSPAAMQAANLSTQTGPVQFAHSPIQPISEPAVSMAPTSPTSASSASQGIAMPVQMEAWGEKISERVLLMAGNQLKSANIRLTPAELGPLHVKVSVDDGTASVTFNAQHATTREALEMALPRLREMLAENGIALGQTNIGEQGVSQGKRDSQADAPSDSQQLASDTDKNTEADPAVQQRRSSTRNGLVDTFA